MNLLFLWLAFLVCSLLILYSGSQLSRYGDIIAEKTGLGRLWIGVLLIAFVTSLPELATGLSSVLIFDTPDIAAGDIFGSCVFNMLILALLHLSHRTDPLSSRVQKSHVLSAGFGILLLTIVSFSLYLSKSSNGLTLAIAWIGLYTPTILFIYMVAMRLIFIYEKRSISAFAKEKAEEFQYSEISKKSSYIRFSLNGCIVVAAGVFLPEIGKSLAELTGLGETFVGNALIAISTSLPEIVVSVTAIKIGAGDMAIGGLFGSNVFNIMVLAIDDLFFTKGPLLSYIGLNHILSITSAVLMMIIAVIGLTYRADKKPLFLAWDAMAIVAVYFFNLFALYITR